MVGFKRNGPGAGSWGSDGRKFRKWDGLETEERRSNKGLTSFFPVCFFVANCFRFQRRGESPRYFSMWEDAMGRDHAAVRSI